MPQNPAVQIVLCGIVVVWCLYQLFAPGEAQPGTLIALEWFAVIGGSLGVITAIYRLATGKQLGAKEKSR